MVKARTKVLLSAYACEPNKGSEPGVGWNWALHLAKNNEVYVITRLNNKDKIEEYLIKFPQEHLHFYYHDCGTRMKKIKKIPNGIFIYYQKWQKEIVSLAKEISEKEEIDIIHHITFNEFRTPGKLYKINKPFVWGPIGGGQFYNSIFKDAYFNRKDLAKEYLRNFINKSYLRYSDDIHAVKKRAAAILIADQSTERTMSGNREYIRLLETGYNLERNGIKTYDDLPLEGYLKRPINLLWVGGIWPRKGLKLIIDALGESSFRNFKLTIVGNGQDKIQCEKLVVKYNMEENIKFLGSLNYDEVNEKYSSADIFLFTSLRDTSGNVVLEAMSHGLPVIALNHHGVGEIVTDETGIRVEITSYEEIKKDFVEAIKKYIYNPRLIINHGKNARDRIESEYSWQHNINIMEEVYKKVLDHWRKIDDV